MKYEILYKEKVKTEDIPSLDKNIREQIKNAIETKLGVRPEIFGKPLRNSLKGYRKLRVGDYRIVFELQKTTITIMAIKHRSKIYKSLK